MFDPGAGRLLTCQSRACGELVLRVPDWLPQELPRKQAMQILVKETVGPDVIRLLIDPQGAFPTKTGQHLRIRLESNDYRCFSVANRRVDPHAPIELHIRRVAGGRFSDSILSGLAAGSMLEVEGPFGISARLLDGAPLVLIATGTGYAGIRALLESALADPTLPAVTLYWGGRHATDHYARAELDSWCAADARLRWTAVYPQASKGYAGHDAALQRHVQDYAIADRHDWSVTQVHACGNPGMLRDAKQVLTEAGLPLSHWHADAFVPSGSDRKLHEWERTGTHFDRAGIIAARDRSIAAVYDIAARILPGMTSAEARRLADERLLALGAQRTWHPTIVRFGPDTTLTSRESGDPGRRLLSQDIVFIDIGPVWDGYEGDYGDTFVIGNDADHLRCAEAARVVFEETAAAWRDGASGAALYDFADGAAQRHGCTLVRETAGHRIADFPHALYGRHKLAQAGFTPADGLWVLEIQVRDHTRSIGAFFEDVLLRE